MIDIIIVNYNTPDFAAKAIDSVYKYTDWGAFNLIVVDNGSSQESRYLLHGKHSEYRDKGKPFELWLLNDNIGVGPARNMVIKKFARTGNDVVFMDSDAEIRGGNWLPEMQAMLTDDIGKVEAKVEIHDGSKQFGGTVFQLTKREVFDTIGGYDENFFSGEDEDWRIRFQAAGFKTAYCKTTNIFHRGGGTLEMVLQDAANGSPIRRKGEQMFKEKYTEYYFNLYHVPFVLERNAQPLE